MGEDANILGYKKEMYSAMLAAAEKSNKVRTEKYFFDLAIVSPIKEGTILKFLQADSGPK